MKKSFILALIFSTLLPLAAHAQFERWPTFIKAYEIGYGYSSTTADYQRTDKLTAGSATADTTISISVKSKFGFGASMGTYFPLTQLGRKSKLTLDVSLAYNFYTWDYPSYTLGTTANGDFSYNNSLTFSGATFNAGLPIGLSTRIGCDAMMDKKIRWCWNAGAGVLPSINLTSDLDNASATFGVQPYVKTEVGIYGGLCWKIRLMYAIGNLKYIDAASKSTIAGFNFNSESNVKLTGKGNFTASIVIMPFAWMWKKSAWYNSYR